MAPEFMGSQISVVLQLCSVHNTIHTVCVGPFGKATNKAFTIGAMLKGAMSKKAGDENMALTFLQDAYLIRC